MPKFAWIPAIMATTVLAGTALAQEVRTPEGALLQVDESLAYKDGELGQDQLRSPTRHLFTTDYANVFRRFPREHTEAMVRFYVDALGLRSLSPIQLTPSQQMILTGVGHGQIKLSAGQPEGRSYHLGGINAGTGIRFFRLAFPHRKALVQRFRSAGFAVPKFTTRKGMRWAVAMDPGGFPVMILIDPAAKPHGDSGVGIGINVTDVEKSRDFYRSFVGLDELPPYKDAALGTTVYPFRNGETTVLLFSTGGRLPHDNGSAGIQYIVSDAAMVEAKARHRGGIEVQAPLNKLRGFDLTTIWFGDPDGQTNYFAQIGPNARAAPVPGPTYRSTPAAR